MAILDHSPVHSDPELMGGTLVFHGTRVPAQTLFDYLDNGYSMTEFLNMFPSVHRDDAEEFLRLARGSGDGAAGPTRAFGGRTGREALIAILPEGESAALDSAQVDEEDALGALIDSCKSHTGIPDLAAEHDHYAHGKPRAHESSS